MNFNDFTWEFNGKREAGDTLSPHVSIHVHPLKDDWWKNSYGISIDSMGELVSRFFGLHISETTSFHVFIKNNEHYLSSDFPLTADSLLSGKRSYIFFYPDSLSVILKNQRHIKGKRILCDYHLLENCDFLTYRRVTQMRSTFEGGEVLPGQSQHIFCVF